MSDFIFKPATRQGVIPLVGLYAESGCGKTMSALLLARGFVGPTGKIAMIDSESGRGSLYADVIPGGYETLRLEPPFSPSRYVDALQAAFNAGFGIVVIDSMSHEHDGMGGVLDMAAANEEKSGKGLHVWKGPKLEHAKMVQLLLRCPVPVVCCIRAKYKTRQIKDEKGKTAIVKDNVTSPIQDEAFIYELTAHAEILPDHSINLTKASHPDLRKCFPEKGPITIEHGKLLAQWCANPGGNKSAGSTAVKSSKPVSELDALKLQLWNLTKEAHGGDKARFRQYLVDEAFIDPDVPPEDLTASDLRAVIAKVQEKQQPDLVP